MTSGKRLFREVIEEIWHRGNSEFIRTAFHPAFVGNVSRRHFQDLDAYRLYVAEARRAFPDVRFEIHQQVEESGLTVSRYTVRGTHTGEFMGAGPSGNSFRVEGMTMQRVLDGRIAESWSCWDVVGLLRAIDPSSLPTAA